MKRLVLIAVSTLLFIAGYAQSVTPIAIGSGFVNGSSSNAEISSTVGQTAYGTKTDGTNQITEGVHQPEIEIVGLEDKAPEIGMAVYPNPNAGQFYFELTSDQGKSFKGELFNANGISIEKVDISAETNSIDISGLPSGSYFLHVFGEDGSSIKQYKVLKVH